MRHRGEEGGLEHGLDLDHYKGKEYKGVRENETLGFIGFYSGLRGDVLWSTMKWGGNHKHEREEQTKVVNSSETFAITLKFTNVTAVI